ncbi:MAG: YibE/F family protein [Anaerolineales bacterium]|nr:YibE/F family protein [Anaerolineales bacterium]
MKNAKWFFPLALLALTLVYLTLSKVQLPGGGFSTFGSDTVRAEVTRIIEEGNIEMGGRMQAYQIARVKILEGKYAGVEMEIDYGKRQIRSDEYSLAAGEKILVSISKTPENVVNAYFVDFVRAAPILWLAGIFALAIILISAWKGIRALLSMAFSLYVIIGYIIPHILIGEDPLRVSIIGSAILLGISLYLTYGWTLKTHASVLSMILVLLLTGALSALFVVFTKLNGTGDENVMFLIQMMETPINLRGLLLGGMIIGALGVLDDLVTTQSAAVFELRHANPNFGFRALYNSAMRIGQDHVAATVNTLVLAYAGASLPMMLMFSLGHGDYGYIVNFSFIAEEIVRTLVGSLGLIAAVPLTTVIAIFFAQRADSLARWENILGEEGEGHHH